MRALFILMVCISHSASIAQKTGEVDYPYLGIKFTIPHGWKGAENGGGFLMGSDTKPGLIFMTPHEVKEIENFEKRGIGRAAGCRCFFAKIR